VFDDHGQAFPVFGVADMASCRVLLAIFLELTGRRDGTRASIVSAAASGPAAVNAARCQYLTGSTDAPTRRSPPFALPNRRGRRGEAATLVDGVPRANRRRSVRVHG
jgi:hypothetical protein